jgi:two-component system, sensor histidine kinase RpfC
MTDQTTDTNSAFRTLVVDDNAMSRKMLEHRLVKDGHQVTCVVSGEEALDYVVKNPVDVMFLDLHLTGIDGIEVLKALKADDKTSDISVVMVSGTDREEAVTESLRAGAKVFLHKPVAAKDLRDAMHTLSGSAIREEHNGTPPSIEPNASPEPVMSIEDSPVLNPGQLQQLLRDYGATETTGFIKRFTELAPGQCDYVQDRAATGDINEWRFAVHDLKGSARSVGLVRLGTICRDIERAFDENRIEDATSLTALLPDQLEQALATLRQQGAQITGET